MAISLTTKSQLQNSISKSEKGLTVSELEVLHPDVSRRTLQRYLKSLVDEQQIIAIGRGRASQYRIPSAKENEKFAAINRSGLSIDYSADSLDIIRYVNQPISARSPVGYQLEFLDEYRPNETHYLPLPIRKQLFKMGKTPPLEAPARTYSREILNRLLIDLSWASSQLEGNTYSRLGTRELIEHGKAATGKDAIETQMILNHKSAHSVKPAQCSIRKPACQPSR